MRGKDTMGGYANLSVRRGGSRALEEKSDLQ